ncbi:MAG: hypothetical protein F6K50_38065 [Moorea sp. SIO3I7]|uniref:hypothetical protein n=1 Tax=unclassified Moorena TaxID=2683338 RepID=UPI0013C132E1|nr:MULTISPECIES: hypothetical protein [unclassified Moorena]NEO01019.1 hypothetical protein [Moorena sp. SIO3I7]NEO05704.1 hypothetical protein [Moorena sp. SIO3I8]NEO19290.1 hypothetical protein [Moorena sp. SIO4A5]NEP21360.1 hypothetical protein [Moorena sp. SIO3I6]NEQ56863.1 hypothetical protein [Moorena sp. SIO4A1]
MKLSRNKITLEQEAKAGLNSLLQQTAQVGSFFFVLLLISLGNPSGLVVSLSFLWGIAFVAWQENQRLTGNRKRQKAKGKR